MDLTFYHNALNGSKEGFHADYPQLGWYKKRAFKDGPWTLVWMRRSAETGDLVAQVGWKDDLKFETPEEIWTFCMKNPVPKEDAREFYNTGRWPGDVDVPAAIGDNSGDLSLMDEVADYMETARSWGKEIDQKSVDKDTADKAANYATHLGTLTSKLDKERKDKVAPHLEAQREVNGVYNPVIEEAKQLVKSLKAITGVWLRAEDEKRQKELAATNILQEEVARVKAGGQRGRRVGLRTVTKYECEDDQAVLDWALKNCAAYMLDKAIDLATISMKNGESVPGMKKVETKEAV